jgi:subfamily B ATP-binding cassette protein MsbA
MRNYWRFVAYVWRYKVRVICSVLASFLAEALNFASVGLLCAVLQILLNLRVSGEPGELASKGFFKNRYGRGLVDFLRDRASPDSVFLRTIVLLGAGFLLIVCVRGVLDFLRKYLLQSANLRGWTDLFTRLFERMTRLSMRFYTGRSLGKTMSTFGADIGELRRGGKTIFEHAIRDPFLLVGGLVCTFLINVRLALVTFVALPLVIYIIKEVGDRTRRYTKKTLKRRADAMKILGETLQGAAVIKAYNAEDYQIGRFRERANRMLRYGLRRTLVKAIADPVSELLYWACRIAVIIYGVHLILDGSLEPGMLLMFVYCVKQVYQPLSKLRDVNVEIQQCAAAADRIFALLDLEPEVAEKPDALPLPLHEADIEFDRVSFAYDPPNEVVRDFDLRIRAGEVVALVGENGSGKTTVASLLLRFYDPTRGAVRIDGTDLRNVTLASLRRQIAYVSQNVVLFNDTIRRNIAFGDTAYSEAEIEAAARAALAHDFIVNELPDGYDAVVGEGGAKLSGGQRQRISLARALLRDPRIFVMDEATSALDVEAEDRLQQQLAAFAAGRTVILIAHRFSALRYADRIVVLDRGRIECLGTHDELIEASPTYRNLHQKQGIE